MVMRRCVTLSRSGGERKRVRVRTRTLEKLKSPRAPEFRQIFDDSVAVLGRPQRFVVLGQFDAIADPGNHLGHPVPNPKTVITRK